jgi:hypothetical protein
VCRLATIDLALTVIPIFSKENSIVLTISPRDPL